MGAKKKSKKQTIKGLPPEILKQVGYVQYENANYKVALPHLLRLHQLRPDAETLERLTGSYIKRAEELALNNMPSEALTLLDNLFELSPTHLPLETYLSLLIKAKKNKKLMTFINSKNITLLNINKEAQNILICYLVSENITDSNLPTIILEGISTLNALQDNLSSVKELSELSPQSKTISLLSPLREVRVILQALSLINISPSKTIALLSKIAKESLWQHIATVINIALLPNERIIGTMSSLTPAQLKFLKRLKGWSTEQSNLLLALNKLKNKSSYDQVLFFIKQKNKLPPSLLKSICLTLYDGFPKTYPLLKAEFNDELNFYYEKDYALKSEKYDKNWNCWDCVSNWDDVISAIKHFSYLPTEWIGYIHLKQYQLTIKANQDEDPDSIELLINSLKYLPERLSTYLSLCNWYKTYGTKTKYNFWLKKTSTQFPNNIEVLELCAQNAMNENKYTKASSLLLKGLEIDSVNARIKQTLGLCYLKESLDKHANRKSNPAHKALNKIEPYIKHLNQKSLFIIFRALLEEERNNSALLSEKTIQTIENAGAPHICNLFLRVLLPKFPFLKATAEKVINWKSLKELKITELIKGLNLISNACQLKLIENALPLESDTAFKNHLKKLVSLKGEDSNIEIILTTLVKLSLFKLLTSCISHALKNNKKSLLLNYYKIISKIKNDVRTMSKNDFDTLEDLMHEAMERKDINEAKIMMKIGELLAAYEELNYAPDFGIPLELQRALEQYNNY